MAKRSTDRNQLDLFAEPKPEEPKEWQEVSAAVFLSWTESMQLKYCANRDRNSAALSDDPSLVEWYLWRASNYEQRI